MLEGWHGRFAGTSGTFSCEIARNHVRIGKLDFQRYLGHPASLSDSTMMAAPFVAFVVSMALAVLKANPLARRDRTAADGGHVRLARDGLLPISL